MKSYKEYKEEYKKMFFKYPETSNLIKSEDIEDIGFIRTNYIKEGSKWIIEDQEESKINFEFYFNVIDPRAIQFFRNLGGTERVTLNYTGKGYIPVKVVSTNPSRDRRTIYEFIF